MKFYNPELDTFKCRVLNFFTNSRATVVVEDHVNNSKVTEVFFDKSQMFEIPSDLFIKFTNMVALKAKSAKLQMISNTTFVYGENLIEVSLDDNQLKALDEGFFQQLHDLIDLSLRNNLIERVSEGAFFGLESLVNLDLSENKIDHLPDLVLQSLVDLKEITLSKNMLTELEQNLFSFTSHLEKIFLDHNRLTSIDSTIFNKLMKLDVLDLSFNRIHEADFTNFYGKNLIMQQTALKSAILSKNIDVFNAEGTRITDLTLMEHEDLATKKYLMNFAKLKRTVFYINEEQFVDMNAIEPMTTKLPEFIESIKNKGMVAANDECTADYYITKEADGHRLMAIVCQAVVENSDDQNHQIHEQEETTVEIENVSTEPTHHTNNTEQIMPAAEETREELVEQTTDEFNKEIDDREFEP